MNDKKCDILITAGLHQQIMEHLFPGDRDEHGAILRAGVVRNGASLRLLVQHVQPAQFGTDYVPGQYGYRALAPTFIHREILRCRDSGLAYLAIHNHFGTGQVAFSRVDLRSHERGYPSLLQITRGVPVGALVFAEDAVAGDIWLSANSRVSPTDATIVGLARVYRVRVSMALPQCMS